MKKTVLFLSFIFVSLTVFAQSDKVEKIRMAAEQGNSAAQLNMALRYAKGLEVTKDQAMAQHYFEQAARKGSPVAKTYLAHIYSQQAQFEQAFDLLKDIRTEGKTEVADDIWNEHQLWKYNR